MENKEKDNLRNINVKKLNDIVDNQENMQPKPDEASRKMQMQEMYIRNAAMQQQLISGQLHNIKSIFELLNTLMEKKYGFPEVESYLKTLLKDMLGVDKAENGQK